MDSFLTLLYKRYFWACEDRRSLADPDNLPQITEIEMAAHLRDIHHAEENIKTIETIIGDYMKHKYTIK